MNNKYNQIVEILGKLDRKETLQILSEILHKEYDLRTVSNMVKENCESVLNKMMFEDMFYEKGNEEGGFIKLKDVLEAVEEIVNCDDYLNGSINFTYFVRPETEEEIVNCDDYLNGSINFTYFVRPETEEESEDNSHSSGVEWWTKDDRVSIDELYVGFES